MTQPNEKPAPREVVSAYCKIRVVAQENRWCATLDGKADPAGIGEDPHQAIERLFDHEPTGRFEIGGVIALQDATHDGHREFIVTLNERPRNSATSHDVSLNS